MYKILYLAYIEPRYKQLHNKISGQVQALREIGHTVNAFLIGRNYPADFPANPNFQIVDTRQNSHPRHELVEELIKMYKPEMIYFRYPNGYKNVLEPLIPVLEKYPAVIFEHNTREEDELEHNKQWEVLEQEKKWGRQLIARARGLVGVFPSATQHQIDRAVQLNIPTITIGNGLNVSDYPIAKQPSGRAEINVLFSGYIARHHGLERAFTGMHRNPELKINFYIVGAFFDKNYEQEISALVKQLALQNNVHFLGELTKTELNPWFDKCHICVGSLGMHRLGTKDGSSLKTREYLSRGKAIIIDHADPDLRSNLPFIYRVPGDESPIDFRQIRSFLSELILTPNDIREYALQNCDWRVKMAKLIDFMESCLFPEKKTVALTSENPGFPVKYTESPITAIDKGKDSIANSLRKFYQKSKFEKYQYRYREERLSVESYFASLNATKEQFFSVGYCGYCNKPVNFMIDWILKYDNLPGYRERLICPICGLSARKRMVSSYLLKQVKQFKLKPKVFCFEQKSIFYKNLIKDHQTDMEMIGSEYLGDNITSGEVINGLRHENALKLSFSAAELDIIISNDVFEHVSDITRVLHECHRVLKSGGQLVFTVPFYWNEEKTNFRAIIENGRTRHLMPPHFHKDPLRKQGSLVFYDFGWDLLDFVKKAGFRETYILDYYDFFYGYFGDAMSLLFIAQK